MDSPISDSGADSEGQQVIWQGEYLDGVMRLAGNPSEPSIILFTFSALDFEVSGAFAIEPEQVTSKEQANSVVDRFLEAFKSFYFQEMLEAKNEATVN